MARDDTKRAMSEAAEDAKAMRKLKSAGLGEKELAAMKAKYGARAYDLINAAMFPDNVRRALGWKTFKRSGATIKDFIANPLTPEEIEKVTGKKADNSKSSTATRTATKEAMKQQRSNADKAQKAAEDKKRTDEAKKKVETEKKTTQEKARKETKSKSQEKAVVSDKSTTKVSSTLRCQIEKQDINGKVVFKSSVTDAQGVTIPELHGVTEYSMWEGTYNREVGSKKNPVGAYGRDKSGEYWGAMQYNRYGIENVAMYALTKPEYEEYAKRFFKPGYKEALENFKDYVKKKGNNVAYWQINDYRSALKKYIRSDYIESGYNKDDLVRQEGRKNPAKFLQIQRDFATEVYTSQHTVYKRIETALAKKNIKPEQVSPAIWELVLTSAIHRKTYLNAIARLFERPNIDLTYINSANMIEDIRKADKSTFSGSGLEAINHAKDTVHLKHSATTSRELAIILHEPEILANYERLMAQNVVKQADGTYLAKAQKPTKTASSNVRTNNTASM